MNQIVKKYEENLEKYKKASELFLNLTRGLIQQHQISIHHINDRVKSKDSLEGKLVRKNNKYSSIDEISDIIGVRIITYTEDKIDVISEILQKEFEVIEIIDKREGEPDKFGYKSLHLVIKLNEHRNHLTEYVDIKDLKFEVQIRTILQHAWAEIEHDIGYKGTDKLPNSIKRGFARIASLLELADVEFVKIIENTFTQSQREVNDTEKINIINLQSFIKEKSTEEDSYINKLMGVENQEAIESDYNSLIERLSAVGINTVNELIENYEVNKETVKMFAEKWLDTDSKEDNYYTNQSKVNGIAIFYLIYVLLGKNFSEEKIDSHLELFGFNLSDVSGKEIIEILNC